MRKSCKSWTQVVTTALLASGCLAGTAAAPAHASHAAACQVRGAKVVVRASTGLVFTKTKTVEGHAVRRMYGCLYRTRTIVSLGSRRVGGSVSTGGRSGPVIVGRYVAYVQNFGEETQTGALGVNVVDLKRGLRVAGYRYAAGSGWDVESLVLKASGGVAWTGDEPPIGEGHNHVNKIDGPQPADLPANEDRILLDSGPGIDTQSLTLSSDRREVRWVRYDGTQLVSMSAPLG